MNRLVWTAVLTALWPGSGSGMGLESGARPGDPIREAGQDPDDLREYRQRLEQQQREQRQRLEQQQREDRKRSDEWIRDDRKQRREAERAQARSRNWEVPLAPVARPRLDPGWSVLTPGAIQYRSSGYQGYAPVTGAPGAWADPTPGGTIGPDVGGWLAPRTTPSTAPSVPYRVESQVILGESPPPLPDAELAGVPAVPAGTITGLARTLVEQADAFLVAFAPQAGRVPEGARFLADATALRDAAAGFHDLANGGAPPDQLALGFQAVADCWQRLEGRMARVSGGRVGPNIATALEMGQTVGQIQQLLPAPAVGP